MRVCVKVPGKVQHLDKALKRLGGVAHLATTIQSVHKKLTKAEALIAAQAEKQKDQEKPESG